MSLFVERFLRHDGVFLLRLMTLSSNALTTVDLTGALWKNYWKSHPPTSDVTLTGGGGVADQSTMLFNGRRQPGAGGDDSTADDATVKRKRLLDDQYEPLQSDTGSKA